MAISIIKDGDTFKALVRTANVRASVRRDPGCLPVLFERLPKDFCSCHLNVYASRHSRRRHHNALSSNIQKGQKLTQHTVEWDELWGETPLNYHENDLVIYVDARMLSCLFIGKKTSTPQ